MCMHFYTAKSERVVGMGGTVRLSQFVDYLFTNQVVSVGIIKDLYGVSYPTAKHDIDILVDMDILRKARVKLKNAALFVAHELLSISYDDLD